jgi:hypothetical protein
MANCSNDSGGKVPSDTPTRVNQRGQVLFPAKQLIVSCASFVVCVAVAEQERRRNPRRELNRPVQKKRVCAAGAMCYFQVEMTTKVCTNSTCPAYAHFVYTVAMRCVLCRCDLQPAQRISEALGDISAAKTTTTPHSRTPATQAPS